MMLDMDNATALGSTGRVFCLVASPDEIARRLEGDPTERPLLAGSDPRRRIEELLAERGIDASYETVRRWFVKFGPMGPWQPSH